MDAGLTLLVADGPAALTVARLCGATGRTKGSFYHHFPDGADGFAAALIEHWREIHTERVIRTVDQLTDPAARRTELNRLAARLNAPVECAIRRWAAGSEQARTVLRQVDERRLRYLTAVLAEALDIPPAEAADLAQIDYAAFVGFLWLRPDADDAWVERITRKIDAMVDLWSRAGRGR